MAHQTDLEAGRETALNIHSIFLVVSLMVTINWGENVIWLFRDVLYFISLADILMALITFYCYYFRTSEIMRFHHCSIMRKTQSRLICALRSLDAVVC